MFSIDFFKSKSVMVRPHDYQENKNISVMFPTIFKFNFRDMVDILQKQILFIYICCKILRF